MGAGLPGQHVYGCWVCRSSGSSSLRNCRQTTTTDHWHSYCWPTWFLLCRPCHLELTATTHDWHVNVIVLFSETVEDISVSLTLGLHCNLQFLVAASSRRICDVFLVNLRLQFPFNNNNNNNAASGCHRNKIIISYNVQFFCQHGSYCQQLQVNTVRSLENQLVI